MNDDEYGQKLDELDRLLNDPDVPMQPSRIWSLLAELSQRDGQIAGRSNPVQPVRGTAGSFARSA